MVDGNRTSSGSLNTDQREALRRHLPAFLAGMCRIPMKQAKALAKDLHPDSIESLQAALGNLLDNPSGYLEVIEAKRVLGRE